MIVFYFTKISDYNEYPLHFKDLLFTQNEGEGFDGFHKDGSTQVVQLVFNDKSGKYIDLQTESKNTEQTHQIFLIDDSLTVLNDKGIMRGENQVLKGTDNIINYLLEGITEETEVCIYYHSSSLSKHNKFSNFVAEKNPKKIWVKSKYNKIGFHHLDGQPNPFISILEYFKLDSQDSFDNYVLKQKEEWFEPDHLMLNLKLEFLHKLLGYEYDRKLFLKFADSVFINISKTEARLLESADVEKEKKRLEYIRTLRNELLKDAV